MDLLGFCHPTDLSGLSNWFCVFQFGKFCRYYFWFLTLDCCIWTLIYQGFGSIWCSME